MAQKSSIRKGTRVPKEKGTGRATIKDVAAEAGVSVSSVSRVLNGGHYTSERLHQRIMQAVQTLGFEPDYAAQAMRSRATNTVGCMVSDISNPLYGDIVNGAEEEFQRAGYVMMLGATKHEADRETALLSIVRRRRMDGLLMLAGFNDQPAFKDSLDNLDMPCVTIDRELPGVPSVRSDHRGGGYEATRHLISLGHRRIALLTGRMNLFPSLERYRGYEQAHIDAGLTVDPVLVRPQNHASSFAFSDVHDLLRQPNRPTAIITMGTHMLASVMEALASTGMRYPRDISLVCVGDTDLARYATPSISAISWNLNEMGRIAARMLLDKIAGHDEHENKAVYLPTKFIIRHSCERRPSTKEAIDL